MPCYGYKSEKQRYAEDWPSSSNPLSYFWLFVLFYRWKHGKPEKVLPTLPQVRQGHQVEFGLQAADQCASLEVRGTLPWAFLRCVRSCAPFGAQAILHVTMQAFSAARARFPDVYLSFRSFFLFLFLKTVGFIEAA